MAGTVQYSLGSHCCLVCFTQARELSVFVQQLLSLLTELSTPLPPILTAHSTLVVDYSVGQLEVLPHTQLCVCVCVCV